MEPTVGPSEPGLPALLGRTIERQRLRDVVRGAVEGRPGAVLLHGEAGVGKTTLVRSVADEAQRDGVQVLWGSGLRFDAADALFLPLTMALERWLREAAPADRERVLHGVPGVGALLPSRAGHSDGVGVGSETARPMWVVDALVARIVEFGPVLFVVDDVHWADPASRGTLAYLIAGFSHQRLAVVTTHRDEDAYGEEAFRTWVSDLRRMPAVRVDQLQRLDRETTWAQLTALLGERPGTGLVDQVFERSQGNAYLTELLVSEMDAASITLPEGVPAALSEALLAAWHRLTSPGRTLTRFLAVAGRPAALASVRDVLVDLLGDDALVESLREAVDAGILVLDGEFVWFRHPLLAEVLKATYVAGDVAPVHAAWARVLERSSAAGIDEVRRQSALALHFEAAGDGRGAFEASMKAADLAERQMQIGEAARNIVRAATHWDEAAPAATDTSALAALLERGAQLCIRADRGPEAHALVTRALAVTEDQVDPLRASRLLLELADLEWELGRTTTPLMDHFSRAVALASSAPDSPEYAMALAIQSVRLLDTGHANASTLADEAVAAAKRSGSNRALAAALSARAKTGKDLVQAGLDIEQALLSARASGDDLTLGWAFVARLNHLWRTGHLSEAIHVSRELLEHAVEHGRGGFESSVLAAALVFAGDLSGTADVVREGLPRAVKAHATVRLRLCAAVLASRRGLQKVADMHRARAYEVMPSLERRAGANATTWVAEVLLAEARPQAALRLVIAAMPAAASDAPWLDEMLVWGARAAADLVGAGSDSRDADVVFRALEALHELIDLRATFAGDPYEPSCDTDLVQPAMRALFEAERGRATRDGDPVVAWRTAASACERAGMRWDQHVALWRLGGELVHDRGSTHEASEVLRAVHKYASAQAAGPLLHRAEETAALGRIPLAEPVLLMRREASPAAFAHLTEREAEILSHLMANRTNTDIAADLFISPKTVSVHVSNLLRKTSTSSRREAAALAIRLGWGTTDSDR